MSQTLVDALEQRFNQAKDLVVRVGLRAGVGRKYAGRPAQLLSPQGLQQANEMMAWARGYLSHPHPELGRAGAVCPFVPKSLNSGRFYMVLHEEVDGRDLTVLRDILLSHSDAF